MFQKKEKLLLSSFDFSKIQPLENAFAHNDEQYNYPLLGALIRFHLRRSRYTFNQE